MKCTTVKPMKLIIFFLACFALFWSTKTVLAQESQYWERKFPVNSAIYLPLSWQEIPRKVLDEFSSRAKRLNPQVRKQQYDLGFQLKDSSWFQYPYLLVQLDSSGKINPNDLKDLTRVQRIQKLSNQELVAEFNPVLSSLKSGETVFDEQLKIIWISLLSEMPSLGAIRLLSASVLTNSGAVNLYFYVKEQDFNAFAPVFEDIVNRLVAGR